MYINFGDFLNLKKKKAKSIQKILAVPRLTDCMYSSPGVQELLKNNSNVPSKEWISCDVVNGILHSTTNNCTKPCTKTGMNQSHKLLSQQRSP